MKVEPIAVVPDATSVEPSLLFTIKCSFDASEEVPIDLRAEVFAEPQKRLGHAVAEFAPPQERPSFYLHARNRRGQPGMMTPFAYVLRLGLSPRALEALEERREKHPHRNVLLRIRVFASLLQSNFRAVQFNTYDEDLRVAGGHRPSKGSRGLYVPEYPTENESHFRIFATETGDALTRFHLQLAHEEIIEIKSSEWTQVFLPVLRQSRIFLTEIPLPAASNGKPTTPAGKNVARCIEELAEVERLMAGHEWTKAIEHSRKIVEIARNKNTQQLLLEDGFSDAATKDFSAFLQGLSDWQSKYIHTTQRGSDELNPRLTAKREEAELAYLSAVSLVNLIGRKAGRRG